MGYKNNEGWHWGKIAGGGVGVLVVLASLIWLFTWMTMTNNRATPAGQLGYVTQGSVTGKSTFLGMQKGPTSTGKIWMAEVTNFSITPYSYDEIFQEADHTAVLSKDHMAISFGIHVIFKINEDRGQDFVEHYTTMQGNDHPDDIVKVAYSNFISQRLRNFARQAIEKYEWQDIQAKSAEVQGDVTEHVMILCKDTPFDIIGVAVGNIQFPPTVAQSVAEAQAASQVLARKEQEVKQAEAESRKKVAEAKGIAEAMDIVNQKLTPQYIQYQAIQAQTLQINSPNHTVIYIPVGPMGVPLTGTFDSAQGAGAPPAADKK
jgi:regulator of protease activity HflC (stomatin/prohibitin superfamily)